MCAYKDIERFHIHTRARILVQVTIYRIGFGSDEMAISTDPKPTLVKGLAF